VFEILSQLLRKEAGLRVQRSAVHLLYLLLNCKFTDFASSFFLFLNLFYLTLTASGSLFT
jgi:hypothetical protein